MFQNFSSLADSLTQLLIVYIYIYFLSSEPYKNQCLKCVHCFGTFLISLFVCTLKTSLLNTDIKILPDISHVSYSWQKQLQQHLRRKRPHLCNIFLCIDAVSKYILSPSGALLCISVSVFLALLFVTQPEVFTVIKQIILKCKKKKQCLLFFCVCVRVCVFVRHSVLDHPNFQGVQGNFQLDKGQIETLKKLD